ncbi:competence/damage-inducible protein cinA [Granulicella pectinivorans]|uniref:CinA-like protein n=1 Tax=Granulicella pectinivorans TaxID=474950 RepID=A0A1I6MYH9_9BACT|nr:competence/damage-inducible protein A [Granulicella pectinivorans]SFS20762.1 competence/damage-inducible protein cinA [Granulicella pectinivorans]
MIAEIIAAGSEMLTPYRQDTNSLYLTEQLNDLGVTVAFKTIVGDSLEHLTGAARIALSRADIVLFSGGLGPTEDDLTREAAATALGRELHRDPTLLTDLAKRFAARRMAMPENNLKQTDVIDGATILANANGSAPGQYIDTVVPNQDGNGVRKIVILLPGPPRELKGMFKDVVLPILAPNLPPRFLAKRTLRMGLIPESQVDARTAPIYKQFTDVETTILAGHAEIQLHFLCAKDTLAEAQARVEELSALVEQEMGDAIFSSGGESLEEIVLLHLGMRQLTLSTAESCTGGLLAERLTGIPNSSLTFAGGVVVYNQAMKTAFCGVPPELFATHGSISAEVARALAEGIRQRTSTSFGVGITGLAGPSGGTGLDADKPIGLIYIAVATPTGTQVKEIQIAGDRDRIRLWASQHALEMIRQTLI